MLRSMYSGITGLRNFQTKLDVIGNNISNVNTYGFKKGRTVFKDLVSQTVAGASAPGADRGGVNPRQVGLGSQLATIDTLHGQGSSQFTGNTTDLSITGDGFFQVMDGNEILYTRAGNFYLDQNGDLVDGDGRYVVGEDGIINIPESASSMSIGQDGTVFFVDLPEGAEAAIRAAEDAFRDPREAFEAADKALKAAKEADKAADKEIKAAGKALEKAQARFDSAEADHTAATQATPQDSEEIARLKRIMDAAGQELAPAKSRAELAEATKDGGDYRSYTYNDATGAVDAGTPTNITGANSTSEKLRTATDAYTTAKIAYDPAKADYDKALEDNKAILQEAGQIELATFNNPGGLEKVGGNLFRASANSGDVNQGSATEQGFGTIESGFVEMSNVDLAEEFTEMIVAQRGFQANTRIITTSDEILQELVNLKR